MSLRHVQTGLDCVHGLCLTADGARLAASQIGNGREVWAAPFSPQDRILKVVDPHWPGAPEVFIGGSKAHRDLTRSLVEALTKAGYAVRWERDLEGYPTCRDQMDAASLRARIVIVTGRMARQRATM